MITYLGENKSDDKETKLFTSPHYLHNPSYKQAQTIWGQEEGGLDYEYSDRLYEWDYEKATKASKESSLIHIPGTQIFYEKYLQLYYNNNSIQLVHILAGFNLSKGYPYLVFGFKRGNDE